MSLGSMAGCLFTNGIVRRVGHSQHACMVFTALIILSNVTLALGVEPVTWLAARLGYGFAIAALFIISQSWLNDAVENRIRGRVMAVAHHLHHGPRHRLAGADRSRHQCQHAAAGFCTAGSAFNPSDWPDHPAIPRSLPIAGTISFKRAWAVSPVALVSMLAVGGMSMLAGGFTPIHLSASGYSKNEVALLMFAMPIGTLLVQLPAGWISNRSHRRFVLAGCALISALAATVCGLFDGAPLLVLAAFFVLSGWRDRDRFIPSATPCRRPRKEGRACRTVSNASVCLVRLRLSGTRHNHRADLLLRHHRLFSDGHWHVAFARCLCGLAYCANRCYKPPPSSANRAAWRRCSHCFGA